MSESIYTYTPYFYIIQHINSGKYYAGVKHGKGAHPSNLLKINGYKTSSVIIKNIILEEGLESFIVRKIKVFETGEQALDYESRFLTKVNASFNESFLNRSNNSFSNLNLDIEKRKHTNLLKYGYEYSFQNEDIKEKSKQTMLERHGFEYASQVPEFQEKRKQTSLEKYGCENAFQNEEIKEKRKQTMLTNYGVENPFQLEEVKEKSKQKALNNFGVEHPMQSKEVQEKRKQNNLEKYGVENPSSTKDVREKVRLTCNILSSRPIVSEIRKYKDMFNLKLGSSWCWKKQEILDVILKELKLIYGELV